MNTLMRVCKIAGILGESKTFCFYEESVIKDIEKSITGAGVVLLN